MLYGLSAVGRGGLLIQACTPSACLPVAAQQDTGQAEGRRYLGVDVLARSRMTLINTTEQNEEAITGDTAGAISA
jgi:hypothetical protein